MTNVILFFNSFFSYLLVFAIIVSLEQNGAEVRMQKQGRRMVRQCRILSISIMENKF